MNLQGSKPSRLIIIVAVIAVLCLCVVFIGGRGLLGGITNLLGGGGRDTTTATQGDLGRLYSAQQVDSNGCPVDSTTVFDSSQPVFVGLDESNIPAGTTIFMRLYYEGTPVEDTEPIRADRSMQTCVWFQFEPTGRDGFNPGSYEAELYVNGNAAGVTRFQVNDGRASGGALPGAGSLDVELGRAYTSSEVDRSGCPLDEVVEFFPDEPVYVSIDRSYIPRGTEMFARLYQNGRAVEDTEPIVADRDLDSCVWFVFESGSGFQSGEYEVDIFVNGAAAETLAFVVR